MASPFSDLTQELPSLVADRVFQKLTATTLGFPTAVIPGTDFRDFFTSTDGPDYNLVRILERPDPIAEQNDGGQALLLWALEQGTEFEVGGSRFLFGIGFRILAPDPPRSREEGKADSASLVWKLFRVLHASVNQKLTDSAGQNPVVDRLEAFRAQALVAVDAATGQRCFQFIQGRAVYEKLLAKEAI